MCISSAALERLSLRVRHSAQDYFRHLYLKQHCFNGSISVIINSDSEDEARYHVCVWVGASEIFKLKPKEKEINTFN